MRESTSKTTLGRFSDKRYVVAFGRYVGSTEVEPPADEVLVGREGQRAYLIDLLISTGRRGAYLVTGRRGTGKTSFVKHCVAEYEESVFSRFLRGNVGRGVWDRSLVLLFWISLLFGALIVSELLQLMVPLTGSKNILPWLIFAPIGILLLYPCVYAMVVFETLITLVRSSWKPQQSLDSETSSSGILAALGVFAAAASIWFVRGLGEPATISQVLPILGGCYFFTEAASFEPAKELAGQPRSRRTVFHLGLLIYLFLVIKLARVSIGTELPVGDAVRDHIGLGLVLLGLGYFIRGWHQAGRVGTVKTGDNRPLGDAIDEAMRKGANWYTVPGLLSLLLGIVTWDWRAAMTGPVTILAILFVSTALLFVFALAYPNWNRQKRPAEERTPGEEKPKFRPRPGWLLFIKALISIVIAVQLAYPILGSIPLRRLHPWLANLSGGICPERSEGLAMCETARFDIEDKGLIQPIFQRRGQEGYWLLSLLILIMVIHLLEYEWIIRPYLRSREDRAFDPGGPAPWDDWEDESRLHEQPAAQRRMYRSLAELTLPWMVYRSWLPVLPVSVNLGFDRLDHRQVIQAMLVGLRERYFRTFLAWNSGFANLGRFLGVLVLLMLVTLVSGQHLNSLEEEFGNTTWFWVLNRDLAPKLSGTGDLLVFDIFPHDTRNQIDLYLPFRSAPLRFNIPYSEIHLRVYHALLFILMLILARWTLSKAPLLPYKENLRRIEDLLDSLSARTRTTSGISLWEPARWVYSMFVDEHVRETERDPVDPRTVELAFLQILEDIQKGGFRFPGAAKLHLTMPAPEITFVFDELDKLGTRVDPGLMPTQEQETEVLHQERERSIKLRSLLSDLKNILASAPARFIFVGGRDLHDEWLADQTSRQPLLTSIFQTEVYLPALLTDHGKGPLSSDQRLHRRAEEYLFYQHKRAKFLHLRSALKRWRPSFGLPLESLVFERFVPSIPTSDNKEPIAARIAKDIEVIDSLTGKTAGAAGQALLKEFVLFLTHRSMGNPKKLKDLLASFIRPAGREIEDAEKRWEHAPCRHVLRFSDTEIFRIQLIENIYRHITIAFEDRMVQRDDKFALSIFYLTDFLFKFHRRAFSWSNLERVDDLAHIHRLPDLRDLQEEIVNHFSERYLHRMLNGMYAFRFRSDIANEIEYLSRQSAAEMAALNFTLDESQSLKAEYEAALKGREEKNPDLVAAIGELYEFDQDFERARYYYRRAIELLDREIKELTAHLNRDSGEYQPGAPIHNILAGKEPGPGDARLFLPWGAARLRLILQVGMTFEHARDFERAETEYRSARTLARALVRAYVDWQGRGEKQPKDLAARWSNHRLHSLKHMNIVFQPLFAEAWLAEKFVGSIDTSISLIERGLWDLRSALPFVRATGQQVAQYPAETLHANFALTFSQLQNKAGDLYFFKGRQPVSGESILANLEEDAAQPRTDRPTDGYLLRAHYHYALGLHELRRYVWQRVESSKNKLSIAGGKETRTLLPKALPDLLFRAAAGGVNDMAEATLARVSLFSLFDRLRQMNPLTMSQLRQDLNGPFEGWLAGEDHTEGSVDMSNWFGKWTERQTLIQEAPIIDFAFPNFSDERLAMSLKLCLVGAKYFEKGGYPEDAGRELLQVCETVTRYLWWAHAVGAIYDFAGFPEKPAEEWQQKLHDVIVGWKKESDERNSMMSKILDAPGRELWVFLAELAIHALEKADSLFRESRYDRGGDAYLVGESVPAEALTLLCSLGISARCLLDDKQDGTLSKRLRTLLLRWTDSPVTDYAAVLVSALERHRYPMINRLNGIKVLVDAHVLGKVEQSNSLAQALKWTEELLELNTQYDAPLHFTPLLSGSTYALLWLHWLKDRPEDMKAIEHIYRAAQRDLHNSEEMYTMRRAYYEAINDLYYLYDDFNDRQIHLNHSIQMAGAELTAHLKHLVDLREAMDDPFTKVASSRQLKLAAS